MVGILHINEEDTLHYTTTSITLSFIHNYLDIVLSVL